MMKWQRIEFRSTVMQTFSMFDFWFVKLIRDYVQQATNIIKFLSLIFAKLRESAYNVSGNFSVMFTTLLQNINEFQQRKPWIKERSLDLLLCSVLSAHMRKFQSLLLISSPKHYPNFPF